MKKIDGEQSKQIYAAKAIAILSVVCAHMVLALDVNEAGWWVDREIKLFGIVGVPAFFIFSGYTYRRENCISFSFWIKRGKRLVIPLLLLGTMTYALNLYIAGEAYSCLEHVKWVIGLSSWLYYIPVLFCCYALFGLSSNRGYIFCLIIVSIFSNALTVLGVLKPMEWMSPFLNPFNWVLFFAIGVCMRRLKADIFDMARMPIWIMLSGAGTCALMVYLIYFNRWISYWEGYSIVFELLCFVFIMGISWYVRNSPVLSWIGQNTLFIYLVHMQIAGVINTRLPQNTVFYLMKPFIALTVVSLFGWGGSMIAKKIRLENLLWIVGLSKE